MNEESRRDNEPNAESPKDHDNQASNSGDAKSVLKQKEKNEGNAQRPLLKKRESHND